MTKTGKIKGKTDKSNNKASKMSWRERIKFFLENITVEPMLAFYIIPCVLASLATQNLNLEKACRVNLAYPKEVCDALTERRGSKYMFEEKQVQKLVASMGLWKPLLESILPVFFIIFMGSWSDKWGKRKPCMLLPIYGELMNVTGLIICTYFFYELPMEVAGFVEAFFPAITGGWSMMSIGVFSHIADITTSDMRTLRIGIVNLVFSVGVPIGVALSGVLQKYIGPYGVFSISAVMYVMALYCGYRNIEEVEKIDVPTLPNQCRAFIKDFLNVRHILSTFKGVFKKRENNRKKKVIFLMISFMLIVGPVNGESIVTYLFTRNRFNWDEVDYSIFCTYSLMTELIGTFLTGGLIHILRVDDALIAVYSCISDILSGFVYGFAKTSLVYYSGSVVGMMDGAAFVVTKSIVSKLVSSEEIGTVNAVFSLGETLMPLIYCPLYSVTYAATIETMPGAFYVIGGILTLPAAFIFGWLYFQRTEKSKEDIIMSNVEEQEETGDISIIAGILTSLPNEVQMNTPLGSPKISGFKEIVRKENPIS